MERATERTSVTRMHICEVCNKSFTRKNNLSRHLSVHGEKSFQCSHCSKCYSQQVKLKVHTFRHHTNEKQKLSIKLLSCGYCSNIFWRSFNFRSHMAVCKKKSVEPTTLDMKEMILEMTNAERQYRRNLEVGEAVSMLLNSSENLSEESLTDKYKKVWNCTENHKSDMYQHISIPHWNRGKWKYWHAFNSLLIGRLFGLLVKR